MIDIISLKSTIYIACIQQKQQLMFSLLGLKSNINEQGVLLSQIEEENSKSDLFFKEVENWRTAENTYIAKITLIYNNLKDKTHRLTKNTYIKSGVEGQPKDCLKLEHHSPFCASKQLSKILQAVIDSHQSFLSKVNYDIFMTNLTNAEKMMEATKKLIEEQKDRQKDIVSKREQIEKISSKKIKKKKMKEEEEMCQIFMADSVDFTLDQKIRKKSKQKELEKDIQEYEIKKKELIDEYRLIMDEEKELLSKIRNKGKQINQYKVEILSKFKLHLSSYWKNLISQVQNITDAESTTCSCYQDFIYDRFQDRQQKELKKIMQQDSGFVQNSLKNINQKIIDELIQYKKDNLVLNRIRRMMESQDCDPNQTDQMCRLIQLIKKIMAQQNVQNERIQKFRAILNKGAKKRMNFVFVMQTFRLNNQFQISKAHIHSLHCMISQFLDSCYQFKDAFALKQMMILLVTYYVNHTGQNGEVNKLYIIHFFKKNSLWRDVQYWDSILLECIYLQKKNTINAMIIGSFGNLHRKNQLLEAQRAAILNQMLIVVRNMIIFEFTQKQVKTFASRFIKLLKMDQKFHKDVNVPLQLIKNTIEQAIKEQTKLHKEQKQQIRQFYKQNFDRQESAAYTVPVNVRKSYIA